MHDVADRPILYLACPYTHPDPQIRQMRFEIATRSAAALIKQGRIVFSPITMTHPIDLVLAGADSTLGSDFWVVFDVAFMQRCDAIAVLTIEGWESSHGVRREIAFFTSLGKPVEYLDPNQFDERLEEDIRIAVQQRRKRGQRQRNAA